MRVLIFALLALAVNATNYGYQKYYSGYPSYAYDSYPSSYYGGNYGSSLYGGNYGSSLYGGNYGSSLYGAGYGLGNSYYTTAYKPAVYHSSKYSYWQPYGSGAEYKSGDRHSGAPGKIEFILGGTGTSTLSGYNKPAVPRPVGVISHGTKSIHRSGAQGAAAVRANPDVFKVSTLPSSRGAAGIPALRKTIAPVTVAAEKDLTKSFHRDSGCAHKSRAHGTAGHSQISFIQDFSKVVGHSGFAAGKQEVHSFQKVAVPVPPVVSRVFQSRPVGGVGAIRRSEHREIVAGQPHIGSKGSEQSQQVKINPEIIHSSVKDSTPVVGTVSRPSSGYVRKTSPVQKAFTSAEGPHVSFILGHSANREADVKTFPEISAPVVVPRPSSGSGVVGALSKFPAQGFSGAAGPSRISFTQDFSKISGHRNSEVKPIISVVDKLTAPVIPGDVASHGFEAPRRSTVKFTSPVEAKPAQKPVAENLAFTAPNQPVAQQPSVGAFHDQSFTHRLFPVQPEGHFPEQKSIFAAQPAVDIVDYKHEITTVEGHRNDKLPSFVIVPEAGNVHDKSSAFKHSAVNAATGAKLSNLHHSSAGISGHGLLDGKVSSVSYPGDKSNVFLAVTDEGPASGRSTALLHSTGVATGSFVEEKGSVFELSSGGVDSTLSKPGQVQGYNIISTPFKNYYSSSYPGYSHVSGESPRFDFSHDRSLLYTYGTPYSANPFSYAYSSANKHNGQVSTKTFA